MLKSELSALLSSTSSTLEITPRISDFISDASSVVTSLTYASKSSLSLKEMWNSIADRWFSVCKEQTTFFPGSDWRGWINGSIN